MSIFDLTSFAYELVNVDDERFQSIDNLLSKL